jgi:hypothetical protein
LIRAFACGTDASSGASLMNCLYAAIAVVASPAISAAFASWSRTLGSVGCSLTSLL